MPVLLAPSAKLRVWTRRWGGNVDVDEADVLATIKWAQDQIGDRALYAVALVGEGDTGPQVHRRGLTWLVGVDVNDAAG